MRKFSPARAKLLRHKSTPDPAEVSNDPHSFDPGNKALQISRRFNLPHAVGISLVDPAVRTSDPDESTHESEEDAEELHDVCVGDGVEAAEQRVEDGDAGRHDHGRRVVDGEDDGQRRAYSRRTRVESPSEFTSWIKCSIFPFNNSDCRVRQIRTFRETDLLLLQIRLCEFNCRLTPELSSKKSDWKQFFQHQPYEATPVLVKTDIHTCNSPSLPRAERIAADQKTSPSRAGM